MNKIVEGLKDAVRSAGCDHDWIVKDVAKMPDQATMRVKKKCQMCGTLQTQFIELGRAGYSDERTLPGPEQVKA